MISHRNVIANVMQMKEYESVGRKLKGIDTQVEIGLLPFSHIYGLVPICHAGTYRGDALIVLPKFELETFLAAIQTYKIQLLRIVSSSFCGSNSVRVCPSPVLTSLSLSLGPANSHPPAAHSGCHLQV